MNETSNGRLPSHGKFCRSANEAIDALANAFCTGLRNR
jgi:hypothetical protein